MRRFNCWRSCGWSQRDKTSVQKAKLFQRRNIHQSATTGENVCGHTSNTAQEHPNTKSLRHPPDFKMPQIQMRLNDVLMRGVYLLWHNVLEGVMGQRTSTWMPRFKVFTASMISHSLGLSFVGLSDWSVYVTIPCDIIMWRYVPHQSTYQRATFSHIL